MEKVHFCPSTNTEYKRGDVVWIPSGTGLFSFSEDQEGNYKSSYTITPKPFLGVVLDPGTEQGFGSLPFNSTITEYYLKVLVNGKIYHVRKSFVKLIPSSQGETNEIC